ncbi:MAG: BMP family ABC transporter substrate-binding protein [Selenomonadaceae bacterium]|nr:BMP family ABC transporter substrate-binding protein [Selenomonadaceae bacterium]
MKLKKTLRLLITLLLILTLTALSGCGNKATAPRDKDALRIALITSPEGAQDNAFNRSSYEGVQSFLKTHPKSTLTCIQESTGEQSAALLLLENIIADFDVVICTSFVFGAATELGRENPDTHLILVDCSAAGPDGQPTDVPSIFGMTFAEEESGFCAGVAAALTTRTGKVGGLYGIAFPSVVNYQYGFESGINYANKHYGTHAENISLPSYSGIDVTGKKVGGNYAGSFADPATGKVISKELLKQGCDVLFGPAGATASGLFTAVKEAPAGTWAIGFDADQYDEGAIGNRNIILTSALKRMDLNVERQLTLIAEGKFQGKNERLDAAADSTGYVKTPGRHQLAPEVIAKLDEVMQLIKEKKIKPAAFGTPYTPENFPGL